MLTYIRPKKCNAQILNEIKDSAKGFVIVIVKITKTNDYTTMATILYVTKSTKHYKSNHPQTLQSI